MSAAFVKQALLIVALALAGLRGLVAPGLMIVASPIDGVRVVLCSAHGADESFVLTSDGDLIAESELPAGDSIDELCPYGAAPQAFAPPLVALLSAPLEYAQERIASFPPAVAVGHGLAAPPPPAQAPPVSR